MSASDLINKLTITPCSEFKPNRGKEICKYNHLHRCGVVSCNKSTILKMAGNLRIRLPLDWSVHPVLGMGIMIINLKKKIYMSFCSKSPFWTILSTSRPGNNLMEHSMKFHMVSYRRQSGIQSQWVQVQLILPGSWSTSWRAWFSLCTGQFSWHCYVGWQCEIFLRMA